MRFFLNFSRLSFPATECATSATLIGANPRVQAGLASPFSTRSGRRTGSGLVGPVGAATRFVTSTNSTPPAIRVEILRPQLFPERTCAQPEPASRRRHVHRCDMAFRHKSVLAQHPFQLPGRIGAAKAKRRFVATRPKAGPVWHDKQRPAARAEHAPTLFQQRSGMIACLQPVHNDQPVRVPGFQAAIVFPGREPRRSLRPQASA